jgi:hypothetical protein
VHPTLADHRSTNVSFVQIGRIQRALERDFSCAIDVADVAKCPPDQRHDVFLSRSLAAYALVLSAELAPAAAGRQVTDESGDNGIDAVYYDASAHRLYVVQSKWNRAGKGAPKAGEVLKFLEGADDLLRGSFGKFGPRVAAHAPQVLAALDDTDLRLQLLITHTGEQALSKQASGAIDKFLRKLNAPSRWAIATTLSQRELHDSLSGRVQGEPITLPGVALREWGQTAEPFVSYYGHMSAADVAKWHAAHGDRLFAKNLRKVIADSEINDSIAQSLRSAPDTFFYLNNGITVICDEVGRKPHGGGDRTSASFLCRGVSVVNGAQTVGAIAVVDREAPERLAEARVAVRLISLEGAPEQLADAITRATNTQNRISDRDFAALDGQQRRLRSEFLLDDRLYSYRSGDETPPSESGCTIEEATVALACAAEDVSLAVIAKSASGRFWQDLSAPPYTTLFHSGVSSHFVWNAVQVFRVVNQTVSEIANRSSGAERHVAVHGNRFILHRVFAELDRAELHHPELDASVLERAVRLAPVVAAHAAAVLRTQFASAYPQTFFKSPSKCQELLDAMGELPSAASPAPENLRLF